MVVFLADADRVIVPPPLHDATLHYANGTWVYVCADASCRDRCGERTSLASCSCDVTCQAFGDCCIDYEATCSITIATTNSSRAPQLGGNIITPAPYIFESVIESRRRDVHLFQCSKIRYMSAHGYVMNTFLNMISYCSGNANEHNKNLCEGINGIAGVAGYIPISTNETVFKNIFCAQCNGFDFKGGVLWQLETTCPQNQSVDYIPGDCHVFSNIPVNMESFACNGAVSKCTSGFSNDTFTMIACQKYGAKIVGTDSVYKNQHCALCNGYTGPFTCPFDSMRGFLKPVRKNSDFSNIFNGNKEPNSHIELGSCGNGYLSTYIGCENSNNANVSSTPSSVELRFVSVMVNLNNLEANKPHDFELEIEMLKGFVSQYNISNFDPNITKCELDKGLHWLKNTTKGDCFALRFYSTYSTGYFLYSVTSIINKHRQLFFLLKNATVIVTNAEFGFTKRCIHGFPLVSNQTLYTNATGDGVRDFEHSLNDTEGESESFITSLVGSNVIVWFSQCIRLLPDNCTKVFFAPSEFHILDNRNAYLSHFQQALDSFEFRGSGILTCKHSLDIRLRSNFGLAVVSLICLSVSMFGLALTFATYCILPTLRNNPQGKAIICFTAVLFFAQLSFVSSDLAVRGSVLCKCLAAFQHYCWLASFSWMNIIGFNVHRTFTSNIQSTTNDEKVVLFLKYNVYGWLSPCIFVVFNIIMELTNIKGFGDFGYGRDGLCWLNNGISIHALFVSPVAIALVINLGLFMHTVVVIHKATKAGKRASNKRDSREMVVYARLSTLMGFTWVFGFITIAVKSDVVSYIFIVLNATQGFFVCVSFVFQKSVLNQLKGRCIFCRSHRRVHPEQQTESKVPSVTSSTNV